MKKILAILILALSIASFSSEPLTASSLAQIDKITSENENVLIMLHVNWCGFCKKLKPKFNNLFVNDNPNKVVLVLVDVTDTESNQDLEQISNHYKIKYYPTFYAVKNGAKQQYKAKELDENTIVSFINDIARPKYQIVSAEQLVELSKNDKVAVSLEINRANNWHQKIFKVYEDLASSMNKKASFYVVDSVGTADPLLKVQNNRDQIYVAFQGQYTLNNLKNFVTYNLSKVVAEFKSTKKMEFNKKKYTLIVMLENEQKSEKELKELTDAGEMIKAQISGQLMIRYLFTLKSSYKILDLVYNKIEKLTGLEEDKVPKMLLLHDQDEEQVIYDMGSEITAQNIMTMFRKVKKGAVQSIDKSESIPETQDEHVYKLVYKTFDSYLDTTRKDLLIYFYADWCGYCNKFTPQYQEIAKKYKAINPEVQFVKYNADKNGYVYEISGFPTLIYYNRETQYFTQYKGNRSEKSIIEHIEKEFQDGRPQKQAGQENQAEQQKQTEQQQELEKKEDL